MIRSTTILAYPPKFPANASAPGCANRGLDLAKDLSGEEHYAGLVRRDADDNYYLETLDGASMLWADSMLWAEALTEPVAINAWVPHE